MGMYVSRVLDSQLLNGWTYGHENGRVCSRMRSHDSVIFRINIFLVTASLRCVKLLKYA